MWAVAIIRGARHSAPDWLQRTCQVVVARRARDSAFDYWILWMWDVSDAMTIRSVRFSNVGPPGPAHEAILIHCDDGTSTLVHFQRVPPEQPERQLPGRP